jgi:hypothetical protein
VPYKSAHIAIAHDHESVMAQLNLGDPPARGWASTMCFYTALHYVEAFFSLKSIHSADHRTRDSSLSRYPETMGIYDDFSELKNVSTSARYFGRYPSNSEFNTQVKPALDRIKSELAKYF